MNESKVSEPFPLWALLPKRETNVESFLQKRPEYDGRGTKIAIFDTGIDPGAAGLQVTTDYNSKIVDMIDATGAGDVDTSTIVEIDPNGFIKGLTGTPLKVPKQWTNPSGKYHMGVINIYDLYPTPLRERMTNEYTENEWQPMHSKLTAEVVRQLQDFQNNHLNSIADSPNDKLIREDLQSKVDYLRSVNIYFKDLGPTFDCIVFNDGNHWKGVIDTTGAGKLEECTLLGNYRECHKYGTISDRDMYNYGLNIYDEGNLLEIVGLSGDHGTHVASIAAAHFPNEPIKNGIAPGAQIVSVCVGDKRLDSRITESALIRGLIKAIESDCQVINLSYGGFVNWPEGRVLDLIDEVVNKYGIIFVTSAGNDGPALTTVGTPPTMKSSSVISVGAYITPDMMIGSHSLPERMPGIVYTWTARGPTINGDLGVNLCAPGGAITSVPNFELKRAKIMSGTSMSSPNVAGSICVLLSGLKAQNIEYSPYSLRRSLENTALKVLNYEPFTHGHGLIQVEKAFEYLNQFKNTIERDVRFHITSGNNLGIYLRQWHEVQTPSTHLISIEPIFLNHKQMDSKRKIDFEMNLSLYCDKQWVICPQFLNMTYSSRDINVEIKSQTLEEGNAYFALITALDAKCPEKGPIFHIPITVIKPLKINCKKTLKISDTYSPGYIRRLFLDIPSIINSAVVRLKNCDENESSTFIVQSQQLSPHTSNRIVFDKFIPFSAQEENSYVIRLKSCRTLELCFGKYWSSIGESELKVSVEFHCLQPFLNTITMMASEGIKRIDIKTNSGYEEIKPIIIFNRFNHILRAKENQIRPLKSSDVIPPGRHIYEILLTYSLEMLKSNEVTISCPFLAGVKFASEYESLFWMLFNSEKEHLASGEADSIFRFTDLERGNYTIKLQVRHESVPMLENLKDIPIRIEYKLQEGIFPKIYDTYLNAITDGTEFDIDRKLCPHTQFQFYVKSLDDLPKDLPISCGAYFSGCISYLRDRGREFVEKFDFYYVIDSEQQTISEATEEASPQSDPKQTSDEEFIKAIDELKICWLSKLKGKTAEDLFDELYEKHKSNPQLLLNRIQSLDSKESEEYSIKHLTEQISLANQILDSLKDKKDISEHEKSIQLEALVKNGVAIYDLFEIQKKAQKDVLVTSTDADNVIVDKSVSGEEEGPTYEKLLSDADEVYSEMSKLIDPYDPKVAKFTERHSLIHQHFGRALKLFGKLLETEYTHEVELKKIEVLKQLNWSHLVSHYNRCTNVRNPKNYRLL